MTRSHRARTGSAAAAALAATALFAIGGPAAPALAGGCSAPNKTLLTHQPTKTHLPKGAVLKVWDTGKRSNVMDELRISEVVVPKSSALHLQVMSSGALTRSKTPSAEMKGHKHVVAMTNGDVFDASIGALPVGGETLSGQVVKALGSQQLTTLISRTGRTALQTVAVGGQVTAGKKSVHVTGVNWQSLYGSGVNVYTPAWGAHSRPYGDVDVVVSGGKVRAVRTGSNRGRPAKSGQKILTGTGSTATFLKGLRVGKSISVSTRLHSPAGMPFNVDEGIHANSRIVKDGALVPHDCSSRNEELRPHTALGWDKKGDLLLIAVSGRAYVNGVPFGGSTLNNMAYYVRHAGAYNAVAMDGGGSTTMVVRKHLPGTVQRVDRPGATERAVPNFLAIV